MGSHYLILLKTEISFNSKKRRTVLLDYGAEETTLYLDTGSVTVIDSLFSSIPNFKASNLIFVPGYENVKFEIWAGKIEKGGVEVDVVEVRNPKPFDPNRKESNEANINKPLKIRIKNQYYHCR